MTLRSLVFLLFISVSGCSQPVVHSDAHPEKERYSKLPTATEVFNLRTKCAQLADALDDHAYGSHWRRDVVSNYSVRKNRCYVDVTDQNETDHEFFRSLYDGQTRQQLGFTQIRAVDGARVGQTYDDDGDTNVNVESLRSCHPGGDCGFARVNEWMNERMKR